MNGVQASLDLVPVASVAASALVSALWEGAVLAGLAWACLKAFPRLSAAARSMVWLGVFALLVGLQVLAGRATPASPVPHEMHLDARWSYALLGLWVTFSLLRAVQLGIGVAHLRRLAKRAVEIEPDAELAATLDELAAGRRVRLCVSDEIARPSVIGFFGAKILLPTALLQNLSPTELLQVLIHEMEHLRRADDWTNLLQKVALVVFPLNPALAWVERRLCAERELACDDRVLEAGNGRKAYALCLAHLAEHAMWQRGMSLALGAWERRPELVRRVERILRGGPQVLSRRLALGVTGGVMAASLAGALALSRSPEVVSFAPAPHVEMASNETLPQGLKPIPVVEHDVRAEARTLPAGAPQMVRTTMRSPVSESRPGAPTGVVVRAVMRCKRKPAVEPEVKLAGLRKPMDKAPGGETLLVMTEWNDLGVQQRVILAALRGGKGLDATVVPAVYLVATPNGWVIVQI
jgi:beta-lactamase regulating signal transducer with metallopeptidase domain